MAFGRGPGAFTGLRTACSVAQGLAFGAGLPVLPIDSLALIAEDAWARYGDAARQVWVAMDARMDEAYAAAYSRGDGQLGGDAGTGAVDRGGAGRRLAARRRRRASPARRSRPLPTGCPAVPRCAWPCRTTAPRRWRHLARQAWLQGQAVDAALALPLYLRDKVALTTAEREAAAAAKAALVTVQ